MRSSPCSTRRARRSAASGANSRPPNSGDDTVGGQATFVIAAARFDDIVAVHVCIRVVTGNYDDFAGRTEVFCEPLPAEKSPP